MRKSAAIRQGSVTWTEREGAGAGFKNPGAGGGYIEGAHQEPAGE